MQFGTSPLGYGSALVLTSHISSWDGGWVRARSYRRWWRKRERWWQMRERPFKRLMAMGKMMKSDEFKRRVFLGGFCNGACGLYRCTACSKKHYTWSSSADKHTCSTKLTVKFKFTRAHTQQCSLVRLASIAHTLKVLCEATGQLSGCKANQWTFLAGYQLPFNLIQPAADFPPELSHAHTCRAK